MLTTSMTRAEIVGGHLLAMFSLTFIQGAILIVFGQLALGVDYLRVPLGTLAVLAALALWVAALGMLIGASVHGEDQASLAALIGMFVFSALGGAWFPLEGVGGAFAAIGRLTPSAWAMTGFQNVIVRGLGMESVWLPAGIMLAFALGFFGLAMWRLRFE